jgi:hypothetical protein
MAAELRDLYTDPTRARIAEQAAMLAELVADCQHSGRPVPASVLDAVEALWRWAAGAMRPRGRRRRDGRLTGPYADVPLPFDGRKSDGPA